MEQGALEPSLEVGRQDLPSLERTCNVEETMREQGPEEEIDAQEGPAGGLVGLIFK